MVYVLYAQKVGYTIILVPYLEAPKAVHWK